MKKNVKKIFEKTSVELLKDASQLRNDMTKIKLEHRLSPQKDTNMITKKRKQLAVVLTVLQSKKN